MVEYTEEFRELAVAKSNEEGVVISELAAELGVTANQLYNWRYEARKRGDNPLPPDTGADVELGDLVADLRQQVADLLDERRTLRQLLENSAGAEERVAVLQGECDEWQDRWDSFNEDYDRLLRENHELYDWQRDATMRIAESSRRIAILTREVEVMSNTLKGLMWTLGRELELAP